MSDASKPFAFSQFVPGFDFLKNLASGSATAGAVPGMPSLSSWVAPTLSIEEVDKRIQELKTVQYWLEQNGHALKATIQALEVQKMTLSTLRGMNVRMEDLASAFTRAAPSPAAPAASPASTASMFRTEPPAAAPVAPPPAPEVEPEPEPQDAPEPSRARSSGKRPAAGNGEATPGVVDPLQWWGALTQQFQQIAASALQDAAHLKMPQPLGDAPAKPSAAKSAKAARPAAAAKKKAAPARRGAGSSARGSAPPAAPARKR